MIWKGNDSMNTSRICAFLLFANCTLLAHAFAADSNSTHRVEAPTRNTETIEKRLSLPVGKAEIILSKFNGLLYNVKIGRQDIQWTDTANVPNSPLVPKPKGAQTLVATTTPSAPQRVAAIHEYKNLTTSLVNKLIELEKDFRTSTKAEYPDVKKIIRNEVIVTQLLSATGSYVTAPTKEDEIAKISGETVKGAWATFSKQFGEGWKKILEDLNEDTSMAATAALREFGNKDAPNLAGYQEAVGKAAKFLDTIIALKTDSKGAPETTKEETIPAGKGLKLTITVEPKESIEDVPVKGKLDNVPNTVLFINESQVAAGAEFFYTAFMNSKKDKSFSLNAANQIVRAGDEDSFGVSLGTLYNFPMWFHEKLGPSIGVSTNTEKLNYHIGISYRLGKKRNGLFTVGYTMGQINGLSGVSEGQFLAAGTPIPTNRVYRSSFFIGISIGSINL